MSLLLDQVIDTSPLQFMSKKSHSFTSVLALSSVPGQRTVHITNYQVAFKPISIIKPSY